MGARLLGLLASLLIMALVVSPYVALATAPFGDQEGWVRSCTLHIVAVSSAGGGVLGNLTVTIRYPGSGRVFISTSPATQVDTQGSARLAAFAASLLAGVDMMEYDFYYSLEAPSIIVGGPSAGAAMALATLEILTNTTCNPYVDVTGMIQPDTSIGPVGGLKEKLEAAAHGGARLFIVPAGQEVYTYYETRYERLGPFVWMVRRPVTVNLTEYGEELGVRVATAASLLEEYELATNATLSYPKPSPRGGLPAWFSRALAEFVNNTSEKVEVLVGGVDRKYRVVAELADNATELAGKAKGLLAAGRPYEAAITAVDSETVALEAYYLSVALHNKLDVTAQVREVNETLINAYANVTRTASAARTPVGYLLAARAYGKLGIAAYYFKESLFHLEERSGRYYVPVRLFGGMDVSGLQLLAQARAMASWALFWAGLVATAPHEDSVPPERIRALANLLLAEARSAVAYVGELLSEAGAHSAGLELAEALADEAIAAKDAAAVIGLSIESIAQSTRVIHETFTLRPARTAEQLLRVAGGIAPSGDVGAVSRAITGLALNASNPLERLLAASTAVLYAWLERELATAPAASGPTPLPSATATPIAGPASGNTSMPHATTPAEGGHYERLPLLLAGAALASSLAALVVCLTRGRRAEIGGP